MKVRSKGRRSRPGAPPVQVMAHQRATSCRAPGSAMHFSQEGLVLACCRNHQFHLGDTTTQTLAEIWAGLPRQLMVEELARDSYPPGCDRCAVERELGNRLASPAQSYDRYDDGFAPWPRQMEFTLSNRCNLECIQCNGSNSSTIRARREHLPPLRSPYDDAFFEQLPPFLDHLEVAAFLGGEPFLAPEARRVWDLLIERDLHPEVQVTTNATIWNEKVERYVNELRMALSVSIDGATAETFEAIRVGADHAKVLENLHHMLAATHGYGGHLQLNFCLLRANWHEMGDVLLQGDALDVDVKVITVFEPPSHSLLTLPRDELRAIVDRLRTDESTIRARLGRNRDRWDDVVGMLEAEVDELSDETSPSPSEVLLPPPSTRWPPTSVLADVQDELQAWAGRECIDVRFDDGSVTSVTSPAWAGPLRAEGWVGSDLADVAALVAERLGPLQYGASSEPYPGVELRDMVAASADGPVRLRSAYMEFRGRMFVASPDALG